MVILLHLNQRSGMHERGKMTIAPASDAARQGDARGTLLPTCQCRVQLFFFFWFHNSRQHGVDSGRFALNWANSCRLVPYRSVSVATTNTGAEPANSGRNSKKKKQKNKTEENKRCENHCLAKINKKGANAPFGQKPYISVHSYLYLSSHL